MPRTHQKIHRVPVSVNVPCAHFSEPCRINHLWAARVCFQFFVVDSFRIIVRCLRPRGPRPLCLLVTAGARADAINTYRAHDIEVGSLLPDTSMVNSRRRPPLIETNIAIKPCMLHNTDILGRLANLLPRPRPTYLVGRVMNAHFVRT